MPVTPSSDSGARDERFRGREARRAQSRAAPTGDRGRHSRRAAPDRAAPDRAAPDRAVAEPDPVNGRSAPVARDEWTAREESTRPAPTRGLLGLRQADAANFGPDAEPDDDEDGGAADDTGGPPVSKVRRLLSLTVGGFAALLTVGLVFGAYTPPASYAFVILGVQALFVLAWTVASRPPAPFVVAGVGLAAAAAADIAGALTHPASLTPLAYVTAAGFVVGVIGQLLRPAGRVRVTESLGSTLAVVFGVVAMGTLVVLARQPGGRQALVVCLIAAGVSVAVARVADMIVPYPRMADQVPRGGLGIVLGAMAGTAAAAVAGALIDGLNPQRTAIAGLVVAVVAVVIDLSLAYAEASRRLASGAPALWLAPHMQGPLGAFAFAAPAAYAASRLLLVHTS